MSKGLVYKATSDDQKAVSGFVLKELAQMSKNSVEDSNTISAALLERLAKDSPDVRYKVLRALKYLCENARAEFRIDLQRSNDLIRQCMHFKGPPDPLRGDAPYQRVRDAAKDTMTAIFNNSSRPVSSGVTVEGFGTTAAPEPEAGPSSHAMPVHPAEHSTRPAWDPALHGGAVPKIESGAYSTGRMVGYGNPSFAPAAPTMFDKVREAVAGAVPLPVFRSSSTTSTEYSGPAPSVSVEPAPRYAAEGQRRAKGQVGGGWDATPVASVRPAASAAPGGGFGGAAASSAVAGVTEPRKPERKTGNGELEGRLVDEITNPSGVRVLPRPDELNAFVEKCRSLDTHMVASLLDAKLAQGVFQTQLKALCVLEALLKSDNEDVEEYLSTNPGNLEALERSTNTQLLNKTNEVLRLAGLREGAAPVAAAPRAAAPAPGRSAPTTAAPAPPMTSFLDFVVAEPVETSFTAPAPSTAPAAADSSSSAFSFLEPAAPAASSDGGLFSGMTIGSVVSPSHSAQPASGPVDFLGDALASMAVSAPAPTPAPSVASPSRPQPSSSSSPFPTSSPSRSGGAYVDPFDFQGSASARADPLASLMPAAPAAPSVSPFAQVRPQASTYGSPFGMPQHQSQQSSAALLSSYTSAPAFPDLMGAVAPGQRPPQQQQSYGMGGMGNGMGGYPSGVSMNFVVPAAGTRPAPFAPLPSLGPVGGAPSGSGASSGTTAPSSGFSFMGDGKPADSFGFVSDLMRA